MVLILIIILLVLSFVWTFTDPRPLKERVKDYFRLRTALIGLGELLIVVIAFINAKDFPWFQIPIPFSIVILGSMICAAGAFLAIWAKLVMKSKWGTPAEHNIKRQNKIVKTGPFAFSRNPIYLGLIMAIFGYTLALKSFSILLVPIFIIYFYQAVLKEEKILTKHFGKDYLEYKSSVARFL